MTLFYKSFGDTRSFLLIFAYFALLLLLIFYVLGATFDDGGNFDEEYDTAHNDYPLISYVGVKILAAIRNMVGDLQPPSYDYWVGQISEDNQVWPQVMIFIIWSFFVLLLLIQVIFALNFLIATC